MPRVTSQTYLLFIDFRQSDQIIHGARCRPGPTRDTGEVILRVNLDVAVGIVVVAPSVGGIIGGVVASYIAAPHGRIQPRKLPAVVRQKYGERAFTIRNDQLQTQRSAVIRTKLEPD